MKFHAGDLVRVKSAAQILATLDAKGELESMPFMAEMLQYCGKTFEVGAVAHKTCDTIHKTGGRTVKDAVHLAGLRCDGGGHGGCQAACLLFWKTDWLEPVSRATSRAASTASSPVRSPDPADLTALTAAAMHEEGGEPVYSCQATRLAAFTQFLPWWDLRQYFMDLRTGNVGFVRMLRVWVLRLLFALRRLGIGYRASVAIHDGAHKLLTGRVSPFKPGLIPEGQPTPTGSLGLAAGEWVEIKSHEEIRKTLTEKDINRGMRFDPEMVQFCGHRYKVAQRVERLIDERTGRMIPMKSPCIILDNVVCSGDYSERRLFCPRAIYPYFREIWLTRADNPPGQQDHAPGSAAT